LIALKSLGHWVGDIHQPLHVSFLDDRGGNTIRTSGQCPGNLHAVWDNCLVQYAIGPDASEAATDLLAVISGLERFRTSRLGQRIFCNHGGCPNDVLRYAWIVMRHDEQCHKHQRSIS
jgi:hypothetical protein